MTYTAETYASLLRAATTLDGLQDIVSRAFEAGDEWTPDLDALLIRCEDRIIAREEAAEAAQEDSAAKQWQEEARQLTEAENTPDRPIHFLAWVLAVPPDDPLALLGTSHLVIGRPYGLAEPVCKLGVHSWDLAYQVNLGAYQVVNSDEPGIVGADIPGVNFGQLRSSHVWAVNLGTNPKKVHLKVRGVTMATDPFTRGPWSTVQEVSQSVLYVNAGHAFPLVGELPEQGWRGIHDEYHQCSPVDPATDPDYELREGF